MVATSVEPGNGPNPTGSMRNKARGLEWDPFRGLHHGQRHNTPRKQAEYMTASDRVATTLQINLAKGPSIHDPGSSHPQCESPIE